MKFLMVLFFPFYLVAEDYTPKDNSRAGLNKYERIGYNEQALIKMHAALKTAQNKLDQRGKELQVLQESAAVLQAKNAQQEVMIKNLQRDIQAITSRFRDFQKQIQEIHPSLKN